MPKLSRSISDETRASFSSRATWMIPPSKTETQAEILVFVRDQDGHFRFIPGAQLVEAAYSYNSRTAVIRRVMLRHQHHLPIVVAEANAQQALMGDAGFEC